MPRDRLHVPKACSEANEDPAISKRRQKRYSFCMSMQAFLFCLLAFSFLFVFASPVEASTGDGLSLQLSTTSSAKPWYEQGSRKPRVGADLDVQRRNRNQTVEVNLRAPRWMMGVGYPLAAFSFVGSMSSFATGTALFWIPGAASALYVAGAVLLFAALSFATLAVVGTVLLVKRKRRIRKLRKIPSVAIRVIGFSRPH